MPLSHCDSWIIIHRQLAFLLDREKQDARHAILQMCVISKKQTNSVDREGEGIDTLRRCFSLKSRINQSLIQERGGTRGRE